MYKKSDKKSKNKKSIFSQGYSWLSTQLTNQFSDGSHHETSEAIEPENPTKSITSEKKLSLDLERIKPQSLGLNRSVKSEITSAEGSSGDSAVTILDPSSRNRRSLPNQKLEIIPELASSLSQCDSQRDSQRDTQLKEKLDTYAELPKETALEQSTKSTQEQKQLTGVNEDLKEKVKEKAKEEPNLTMTESAPIIEKPTVIDKPPVEEREDFSIALRHKAYRTHKRNSKRLSGQTPRYDENTFIEGGSDNDFIHTEMGKGQYWSHPNRAGQQAGLMDHSKIGLSTLQRLGYEASQGNIEARKEIEASKIRGGM